MSCLFFNNLPENPNVDQIKKALAAAVITAAENAIPEFKRRIKADYFRSLGNFSDDAVELSYICHTSDIMYSLENLFQGDQAIKDRVADAIDNPQVIGADRSMVDKGFYHMGVCYAFFWYGITGTAPEPSAVTALNHYHAEMIDNMFTELDHEISGGRKPSSKPRKSSSWLFWIAMLVIGIIIGIIIYTNS